MANLVHKVNIDLEQNQLINPVLDNQITAPGSPVLGQLYYDIGSSRDRVKEYRTGAWHFVGESDISQSAINATTLTLQVATSTYTNTVVLNEATVSNAGLLGASLWSFIDGLDSDINADTIRWDTPSLLTGHPVGGGQANWFLDEDTFASNSDTQVASQQSIKAYVDAQVSGGTYYRGGYNAGTDTPALETTPGSQGITVGDMWTVTAPGSFYGVDLETGDAMIAEVAGAAQLSDWTIIEKNLTNAVENPNAGSGDNGEIAQFTAAGDGLAVEGSGSTIGSGTTIAGSITITGNNSGDEVQATESLLGIAEIATQGETDTGTDDLRFVTPLKLATYSGWDTTTNKIVIDIPATADSTLTHDLGNRFVQVQVYRKLTPWEKVECVIECLSTTQVIVRMNSAPGAAEFVAVVTG